MADKTATDIKYIVKTPKVTGGRARIDGTRITVEFIAASLLYAGYSVDELVDDYAHIPLTHAQIHAAMAYYYDHQAEIDAEIAESDKLAENSQDATELPPPLDISPETHITTSEAAKQLGLRNSSSIRDLISQGKLQGIKYPPDATYRAVWFVERDSVEELKKQRLEKRDTGGRGRPPKKPD